MEIKIIPNKEEYYPGEILSGTIEVTQEKKTSIDAIEMSLSFQEEWSHLLPDKKIRKETNTQIILTFKLGIKDILDDPKIVLDSKKYIFPFKKKLPNNLQPSFEFPQNNNSAFLRYMIEAKTKPPICSSKTYIIIKSIPKIDKKSLNVEASLSLKKWGNFDKGETKLNVAYLTKNYRLSDVIPLEIYIDNTNSKLKVAKCKIQFRRKLIFRDKNLFEDKFTKEDKMLKQKFKCPVNKKEKKQYIFNLDLRKIIYKDYKADGFQNPYGNKKFDAVDFIEFSPSLDGNIITCEYFLCVKLKYAHTSPKDFVPIVNMPLYIVHKLDDDHIQKAQKEANEKKDKLLGEKILSEFEIINDDEKNEIIDRKSVV